MSMYSVYPMKFSPVFLQKIWGGNKIKEKFALAQVPDLESIGEMWVLSDVKDHKTLVTNGHFSENSISEMTEVFMDDMIGEILYDKYNIDFPILLKIIDANDYLSVQVHPNDEFSLKKHNLRFGKSEMWYVLDADEKSEIVLGFNRELDAESLRKIIEEKQLKEVLNFEKVKKGDIINIPAGMVHALGDGLLIAEIQQTSDTTYRLYDWDRKDSDGNERDLHIEDSLEVIDFNLKPEIIRDFKIENNTSKLLINSPYFETSLIVLNTKLVKDLTDFDSCVIYFAVENSFVLGYNDEEVLVHPGECVLVPAIIEEIYLQSNELSKIIEIIPL